MMPASSSSPIAIDIEIVDGMPVPARIRERIRAEGPTVLYGEAEYAAMNGRPRSGSGRMMLDPVTPHAARHLAKAEMTASAAA